MSCLNSLQLNVSFQFTKTHKIVFFELFNLKLCVLHVFFLTNWRHMCRNNAINAEKNLVFWKIPDIMFEIIPGIEAKGAFTPYD